MAATNRPMFCLSAMSATLRKVRAIATRATSAAQAHCTRSTAMQCKCMARLQDAHILWTYQADLNPQHSARIDASISVLVDLTGANERIFKSPIPLVYTRLTGKLRR